MSRKSNRAPTRKVRLFPTAIAADTTLATYSLSHENFAEGNQGKITNAIALSAILTPWLHEQMTRTRGRLTCREPIRLMLSDLQSFLKTISQADDTTLAQTLVQTWQQISARAAPTPEESEARESIQPRLVDGAVSALKRQLSRWSKVEGMDILRVFLSAQDNANGAAEEVFAGINLCPNRTFAWGLLFAGGSGFPLNLQSFRQMIWVTRYEFIQDAIHDLGRPLPLMEIADITADQDLVTAEATIQHLLTASELAYALSFGAFQLDFNPDNLPDAQVIQYPRPTPRLRINPLFVEQRKK
ncbi:MAG: hypothetical protein P4L53_09165 [Candidatus Obscuribacterales bacterium]|nr:hypothetical protein [Candidatus Obscuribacterales bacterium]